MLKCENHPIPERTVREVLENLLSSVLSKKTYIFDDKEDLLTALESFYNCPVCTRNRNVNRNLSDLSINTYSIDNGIPPKANYEINSIQVYCPFSYKIESKSFAKIPLKIVFDIPENYRLHFYQDEFFSLSGLHIISFSSNYKNKYITLIAHNLSEEDIFISRNNLLGHFVPYYCPKIININHKHEENKG